MSNSWISLCSLLATVCAIQATHTYYSTIRCSCNGRSRNCLRDAWGLHCVDCQGNTEGRHCERCKDGFYLRGAGLSCTPCHCNSTGSVSATCDSRGRCSCKEGVTGEKCSRCPDGPIGPNGCSKRRQLREDSGSLSLPCLCYGHSSQCSAQSGYSIHKITSSFTAGPEGWKADLVQGNSPDNVHFRWSPKHQDLEVISKNSLPVYLYAPAPYLGNQMLSYGQNLSFSLRLDRGVRRPSTNDVILEGAGLQVSASLDDMQSVVPCGQKISYSFRLDEQPGSRWRPQLSLLQFQRLLQNLTAIKLRATFGENGRGYLDDVQLVSAQHGGGVPARWVQTCSCPLGYEGQFCEHCGPGFRRLAPTDGAFSTCKPCSCRGGSCDPHTGDCYSADETTRELSCPDGFYQDPQQPWTCAKCPCADGVSCSVAASSVDPQCDRCPAGATGPRCDICQEGFYGDPAGRAGLRRPCRPCSCNGHIDVSVEGSCDRSSGECLKCVNNTRGLSCESCVGGFYRSRVSDACRPCDCDPLGSESSQCNQSGHCRCRLGFMGVRCSRSRCPSCFGPIKAKMEVYAAELKQLQTPFPDVDVGLTAASSAETEAALRATEELVGDLQDNVRRLAGLEERLQGRLSSICRSQLGDGQDVQNIAEAVDDIKQQQQMYKTKVEEVQTLMEEMRRKLDRAKADLISAEAPLGDAPQGSGLVSTLVHTASTLADRHQREADAVERSATDALSDSEKSLALVRTLVNRENKVKQLIGALKSTYDEASAQVKGLENQAIQLSGEARDESKMAAVMLKDITNMERGIPSSLKERVRNMDSRLAGLEVAVDRDIAGLKVLQEAVQEDTGDLLAKGRAARQDFIKLKDRVDLAKAGTKDALQDINSNVDKLKDTLNTLNGFDQQMDGSRAWADAVIQDLPRINSTIQQAVSNNAEMKSILSTDYSHALGTISQLENLVTSLEGTVGSLPSGAALLDESTKLKEESEELKTKAGVVAEVLTDELDAFGRLEAEAEQASARADAALHNARKTREAVGKTLHDVKSLLAAVDQTGTVDEKHLKELEDRVVSVQRAVDERLRPRLRDMEEQEAAQRQGLTGINQDIDTILGDIDNLNDILKSIPEGCFNSPPIEEA